MSEPTSKPASVTGGTDEIVPGVSRRDLIAAGSGLAALAASGTGLAASHRGTGGRRKAPGPPFDSLRDYMAMMEAHGLVVHVPRIDQDRYHATALFYRMTDMFGKYASPAIVFDEIKVDGEWMQGPVIGNVQAHWFCECLVWGLEPVWTDYYASYRKAKDYLTGILEQNRGRYPEIPPVEIPRDAAPVKQVVLKGDEIDITRYPFIQTNPADGGRYVNTGSHFIVDAEMGPNYGTYRCQIKGPRTLGVTPERISIKSKSSDGLGATGRGEGIAAWATVLLRRQEQA